MVPVIRLVSMLISMSTDRNEYVGKDVGEDLVRTSVRRDSGRAAADVLSRALRI